MMARVVIIGSGIVGAAIAYELSRYSPLKITLIDEKTPASGSTGAALGILMGIISQKTRGRSWRLRQTSIERYHTLIPELEDLTGMKIPRNDRGIVKLLFGGDDGEKWHKLAKVRANQGYSLEIWDLERLKAQCPQIDGEGIIGAVYSPQDRQVNPTILTKALVAGASQRGVNCQFGVKVENLVINEVNGDGKAKCRLIHTNKGDIQADWLIIAAGLGSTPLISSLTAPAGGVTIMPVLGQALLLKPPGGIAANPDFQPVITGNDVHVVPLENGELWLGATLEFPNSQGEVVADEKLLGQLREQAIAFYPSLARATVMVSWSGRRPRPEGKSAPAIEKIGNYDNVILAAGHYRNGVLLAPATAQQVSDLIRAC